MDPIRRSPLIIQLPTFVGVRTVINAMVRMVYPFLPIFARGMGVDLRMMSLAITIRSASGLFGPFLASVGDMRGRKTGMLFGVGLFTAGAGFMVLWPGYPAFVVMLVLGIMANFVFVPSMQAFIGDRVPYERRGLVLGISEMGWSLSYIIGVPLIGLAIYRDGWQAPFPWLAGLGLISMLLLWLILPADPPAAVLRPSLLKNLGQVVTFPPALAAIGFALALTAANELVNLTFGTWLEVAFQVKIAALAVASAIIGISELSSEALASGVVDWLGKRRSVMIGLVLNGLAALSLVGLGSSLNGALVGLFLIYFTFEFVVVSSLPLMTEVMPAARATFMSTFIAALAIGRALGALMMPALFSLDSTQANQLGILPVMLAACFLSGVAFFLLTRIPRGEHEDLRPGSG